MIMIDTSSFTNIFYFDDFQKLRLLANDLSPIASSLTRLTGNSIYLLRTMSLHITFGDEPYFEMIMVKFIVMNIPLAYNTIISRLTINQLKVLVSIYHMVMKLSTITYVLGC